MPKVDEVLKTLQKTYGKKVVKGSDVPIMGRLATGSLALDIGLGGGWPQGKITIINGKNSVAKTATASHAIRMSQLLQPEKPNAWISMEPFDRGWAETNGIDTNKLYVAEPETGEEAVNIFEAFLSTREMGVIVLDSLGALAPAKELENEAENGAMGLRTKLIKKLMMKSNARLQPSKEGVYNNTVCLYLNHIYDSMDTYTPYTVAGGRAVWMFSSLMVTFQRKEFLWAGTEKASEVIGIKVGVKFEKDKTRAMAMPFEFEFFNQNGWDGHAQAGTYNDTEAMIRFGQLVPSPAEPFIKRAGAWYTLPGVEKPVQGDTKVFNYLKENPEVAEELEQMIRKNLL